MAILTTSDFTGLYLIHATAANATLLNDIIDNVQETYCRKLLGDDLYAEFIAGLEEVSPDAKWTKLRDGETYTITDSSDEKGDGTLSKVFRGVKKMLKQFTVYEWNNYTRYQKTTTGLIAPAHELGSQLTNEAFADNQIMLLNVGVDIYYEAMEYIDDINDEVDNTYSNFEPTTLSKRVIGFDL